MSVKNFDLEERIAKFVEGIVIFCKNVNQNTITKSLISKLVWSATSVGANHMKANGASSKKDFRNKIHICKKRDLENKTLVENDTEGR